MSCFLASVCLSQKANVRLPSDLYNLARSEMMPSPPASMVQIPRDSKDRYKSGFSSERRLQTIGNADASVAPSVIRTRRARRPSQKRVRNSCRKRFSLMLSGNTIADCARVPLASRERTTVSSMANSSKT
jgi:hypothetical protein